VIAAQAREQTSLNCSPDRDEGRMKHENDRGEETQDKRQDNGKTTGALQSA